MDARVRDVAMLISRYSATDRFAPKNTKIKKKIKDAAFICKSISLKIHLVKCKSA